MEIAKCDAILHHDNIYYRKTTKLLHCIYKLKMSNPEFVYCPFFTQKIDKIFDFNCVHSDGGPGEWFDMMFKINNYSRLWDILIYHWGSVEDDFKFVFGYSIKEIYALIDGKRTV